MSRFMAERTSDEKSKSTDEKNALISHTGILTLAVLPHTIAMSQLDSCSSFQKWHGSGRSIGDIVRFLTLDGRLSIGKK